MTFGLTCGLSLTICVVLLANVNAKSIPNTFLIPSRGNGQDVSFDIAKYIDKLDLVGGTEVLLVIIKRNQQNKNFQTEADSSVVESEATLNTTNLIIANGNETIAVEMVEMDAENGDVIEVVETDAGGNETVVAEAVVSGLDEEGGDESILLELEMNIVANNETAVGSEGGEDDKVDVGEVEVVDADKQEVLQVEEEENLIDEGATAEEGAEGDGMEIDVIVMDLQNGTLDVMVTLGDNATMDEEIVESVMEQLVNKTLSLEGGVDANATISEDDDGSPVDTVIEEMLKGSAANESEIVAADVDGEIGAEEGAENEVVDGDVAKTVKTIKKTVTKITEKVFVNNKQLKGNVSTVHIRFLNNSTDNGKKPAKKSGADNNLEEKKEKSEITNSENFFEQSISGQEGLSEKVESGKKNTTIKFGGSFHWIGADGSRGSRKLEDKELNNDEWLARNDPVKLLLEDSFAPRVETQPNNTDVAGQLRVPGDDESTITVKTRSIENTITIKCSKFCGDYLRRFNQMITRLVNGGDPALVPTNQRRVR